VRAIIRRLRQIWWRFKAFKNKLVHNS
jgi:hypothetical protein